MTLNKSNFLKLKLISTETYNVVVGKNYKTISFLTGLSALVSVLGLFYKPLKLVAVPLNPEKDINATAQEKAQKQQKFS